MGLINQGYNDMLPSLREYFAENGSISLQDFFSPATFKKLQEEVIRSDFVQSNYVMSHRYGISHASTHVLEQLNSSEVKDFIRGIIGKEIETIEVKPYTFTHRDFKLRTNPVEKELVIIIDVSTNWKGDEGGDICFATEDDTIIIPPTTNTISILAIDEQVEEFITYCNHYTKDERRYILKGKIKIK